MSLGMIIIINMSDGKNTLIKIDLYFVSETRRANRWKNLNF